MKPDYTNGSADCIAPADILSDPKAKSVLEMNIGDSIDVLVEYLVDNDVCDIHPLIMGEVERRLIVKVLERSRGNKLLAAKRLGMSRNTFHRKIRRLAQSNGDGPEGPES